MSNESRIKDVSDTALWVAVCRAKEGERPDALFRDPLGALLAGERGRDIAAAMPYLKMTTWLMAVRTVAIDRLILEAIKEGVDTVLNIGAGLDTRPYRMELPASLCWIEVDFEPIIELKNEKLKAEKPRCVLQRFILDLSDRNVAQVFYAKVGARSKKALVITEGVILYLTNSQAALLSQDLYAVPSFHYWIQDFREGAAGWRVPAKMKRRLKDSPFLFNAPDTAEFFSAHGWAEKRKIFSYDEGRRLGRKIPLSFVLKMILRLTPRRKRQQLRKGGGFLMLGRK